MSTVRTREDHLLPSVLEAIGNTPLVELSRLTADLDGRILAKLEYLNPGLSKKDRIGLQMIEDAEEQGLLKPGDTVVELTSGNTGTGLRRERLSFRGGHVAREFDRTRPDDGCLGGGGSAG
jgi:threonine dehydratase